MSAPIMAGVGIGSSVLGGILGIQGQKKAGEASMNQLAYQAGVAAQNAKIAEQNAVYAVIQGEKSAGQYGLAAQQRMGNIVTAQSASGLDVTSGSAKRVQESQETLTRMDLATIRDNAAKTAFDFKSQAAQYTTSALMNLMGIKDVRSATETGIAGSLISTAGSVASKWLTASSSGVFGPQS